MKLGKTLFFWKERDIFVAGTIYRIFPSIVFAVYFVLYCKLIKSLLESIIATKYIKLFPNFFY